MCLCLEDCAQVRTSMLKDILVTWSATDVYLIDYWDGEYVMSGEIKQNEFRKIRCDLTE